MPPVRLTTTPDKPQFPPGTWERFFTICFREFDRIEAEEAKKQAGQPLREKS